MLKITLLIGCLLVCCSCSNAQEFDPRKLADAARDNGAATYAKMKNYAFDFTVSLRMFDKKGQVKQTLVYRSPAPATRQESESGYRALILIEKNDKPVSDDRVQRETVATSKRIDRLESKQASTSTNSPDPQPGYLKLGNILLRNWS
jgi:hypothetical protein